MSDELPDGWEKLEGGFIVPESPDYDGLESDLTDSAFTWKRLSGGAEVWLDETENHYVHKVAAQNGFTIKSVEATEGPFNAKVRIGKRETVWNTETGIEMHHQGGDEIYNERNGDGQ